MTNRPGSLSAIGGVCTSTKGRIGPARARSIVRQQLTCSQRHPRDKRARTHIVIVEGVERKPCVEAGQILVIGIMRCQARAVNDNRAMLADGLHFTPVDETVAHV